MRTIRNGSLSKTKEISWKKAQVLTIAVFADHGGAEDAVNKLASAGFDIKDLSVVGKGYHTDEKVVGFYKLG